MKILILAQLVAHSGVGVYIQTLSKKLCDKGDEVHILSEQFSAEVDERVHTHLFAPLTKKNVLKNFLLFRKIVRENGIEVVHIQHRIVGIYPGLYNLMGGKLPCTYILHTGKLEANGFLKRLATYTGDRVIAISSEVRTCCIEQLKVKPEKIRMIYNGVDNAALVPLSPEERQRRRSDFGIDEDQIVICIHGRIDPVKGHDVLIEAIAGMSASERARLRVLVSGDTRGNAYYEQIKQSIVNQKMESLFSFVGWCASQDVLSISDVMVQPSRREGFLLSAIEAFFMKVPVIRTRTGGYADMRDCCIGIEADDPKGLREELRRFVRCKDAEQMSGYRQMTAKAYAFASQRCTVEKMVSSTRSIFEEIEDENKERGMVHSSSKKER